MRNDTKAQNFTKAVKTEIAERDSFDGWPCCIRCGLPAPERLAFSNVHFIPRSHGGLGIPQNGLTLCPACHRRYDQTAHRAQDQAKFRAYLQSKYDGWNEEELVYRRNQGC